RPPARTTASTPPRRAARSRSAVRAPPAARDSVRISRHHRNVGTARVVSRLALLTALAVAACSSSSGDNSGKGGRGGFGISGPTRCDGTLPLCESFENGLDGNLWNATQVGDATVTVDDVHAARGAKALHVKTVAGGGSNFAYIKQTKTF